MLTSGSADMGAQALAIGIELIGAVGLGLAFAYLFRLMLPLIHQPERSVALAVGLILLAISISVHYRMDVILATMALGFGLINLEPRRSKVIFELMRSFSVPIYVLFFVLVGARLGITQMPPWLWGLIAVYIVGRSAGKIAGAYLGGTISGSPVVVRRYIGLGLFAQGGVAVGLSIMATTHLGNIQISPELSLGDAVIFGITTNTLILQLLGPPLIKLAAKWADEIGRDVTEDDVIATLSVHDVMDTRVNTVSNFEPLDLAIERLVRDDYLVYPVIDRRGLVVGVLSMDSLKQILADREAWAWLVVADVMETVEDNATPDEPLKNVLDRMRDLGLEEIVVRTETNEPCGLLDLRFVRKRIDEEVLRRRNPPMPVSPLIQSPE
jgi:predicted transcriptional regulator